MDDDTRTELAALRERLHAVERGLALRGALVVLALLTAFGALLMPACR